MADRRNIKRYSRRMEDKMEERLKQMGFELVEDTGRRTQKAGDRIMKHSDTGLLMVVDHKSTQSSVEFKIRLDQLAKIASEAKAYSLAALPAITFSYKNDSRIFIVFDMALLEGVMY